AAASAARTRTDFIRAPCMEGIHGEQRRSAGLAQHYRREAWQRVQRVLDRESEGGVALDDEAAGEEERVRIIAAQGEPDVVLQACAYRYVRRAERRAQPQAVERELGAEAEARQLEPHEAARERRERLPELRRKRERRERKQAQGKPRGLG